jgi:polysaccharide export outer membrane protein
MIPHFGVAMLGAALRRSLLCALAIMGVALTGCSLPRGAALSAEVLREQDAKQPSFSVVAVSRANVNRIAGWPATGGHASHGWLSAKSGPASTAIRSGDAVTLVIWDSQENSLLTAFGAKTVTLPGLQVSPTGTIFVPYLGEVVVNGQTPAAAREQIQKAMEPIAPSAQVQLAVQAGARNSVDLVGGVGQPGVYPLVDRNVSILSVLAQGGGILVGFQNPMVRLVRGSKTYEIAGKRLLAEADKNTTLQGGDKVIITEDERYFTALGATGRESLIRFERDDLSALEAVSMAGGINDGRANPKGVLILREYTARALRADGMQGPEMSQVVFTFDLTTADGLFAARNFRVNPLDTVYATESPLIAANTIFGVLGSLVGLNSAVN